MIKIASGIKVAGSLALLPHRIKKKLRDLKGTFTGDRLNRQHLIDLDNRRWIKLRDAQHKRDRINGPGPTRLNREDVAQAVDAIRPLVEKHYRVVKVKDKLLDAHVGMRSGAKSVAKGLGALGITGGLVGAGYAAGNYLPSKDT